MRTSAKVEPRSLCAYCGVAKGITRNHVIPRSLFTKPLPAFMLTVSACEECNAKKKLHDDYLRDYLALDAEGATHPTAQAVFSGPIKRAIARKQSDLGKQLLKHIRNEPRLTKQGVYLGHYPAYPLDVPRLVGAFKFIVQGLYCVVQRQCLSADLEYQASRVEPWSIQEVLQSLSEVSANGPYSLGDNGEFLCMFLYAEEDPNYTFWLLSFYGSVFITVETGYASDFS